MDNVRFSTVVVFCKRLRAAASAAGPVGFQREVRSQSGATKTLAPGRGSPVQEGQEPTARGGGRKGASKSESLNISNRNMDPEPFTSA